MKNGAKRLFGGAIGAQRCEGSDEAIEHLP
jgi:hypothetical protein